MTALKPSVIKEISQRNKDLTFGYLKENETKTKTNYPQLIKYIILLYSNAKDEFDPDATHVNLKIVGNTVSQNKGGLNNSYSKNVMNRGIYIWKFKFSCNQFNDSSIRIWKTKSGQPGLSQFIDDTNGDNISTGYFIRTNLILKIMVDTVLRDAKKLKTEILLRWNWI